MVAAANWLPKPIVHQYTATEHKKLPHDPSGEAAHTHSALPEAAALFRPEHL
jgi:hypothetical protein